VKRKPNSEKHASNLWPLGRPSNSEPRGVTFMTMGLNQVSARSLSALTKTHGGDISCESVPLS
jgi:hypothetical protein